MPRPALTRHYRLAPGAHYGVSPFHGRRAWAPGSVVPTAILLTWTGSCATDEDGALFRRPVRLIWRRR